MIDVELSTQQWSLPVSSDPQTLPRLSTSSSCDGTVRGSFRVQGNGWIESDVHMPSNVGAPDIVFRINVVASQLSQPHSTISYEGNSPWRTLIEHWERSPAAAGLFFDLTGVSGRGRPPAWA